jgi:hypothetical protein
MGRAARLKGKTLDDRIEFALKRKQEEQIRISELAAVRACQEILAIKTMVWWQMDMTVERMERFARARHKRFMKTAAIHAVLAGTLYSGIGAIRHDR